MPKMGAVEVINETVSDVFPWCVFAHYVSLNFYTHNATVAHILGMFVTWSVNGRWWQDDSRFLKFCHRNRSMFTNSVLNRLLIVAQITGLMTLLVYAGNR